MIHHLALCGLLCGARPDFVDIDYATGNISVPALRERLREAAAARERSAT